MSLTKCQVDRLNKSVHMSQFLQIRKKNTRKVKDVLNELPDWSSGEMFQHQSAIANNEKIFRTNGEKGYRVHGSVAAVNRFL
jgi:hypothetical protein